MKEVLLTESEDDFIAVDHIDKYNYLDYIGQKVNVRGDVDLTYRGLRKIWKI